MIKNLTARASQVIFFRDVVTDDRNSYDLL